MVMINATIDELRENIKSYQFSSQEIAKAKEFIDWSKEEGAEPLLKHGAVPKGFDELAEHGLLAFVFEYPFVDMLIYKEIRINGLFRKKTYIYSVWMDYGKKGVFSSNSFFESVSAAIYFLRFAIQSDLEKNNASSNFKWADWYIAYCEELILANPSLKIGEQGATYVDLMNHAPLKRAYADNINPRELARIHATKMDAGEMASILVQTMLESD